MTATTARRRGVVIVPILVALILVAMLAASTIRLGLVRRRQLDLAERRMQADWLAESALDRASAALARSADYSGETWEVDRALLGGRGSGTVEIAVDAPADRPGVRVVRVRAEYPAGSDLRARESKSIEVQLERGPAGPGGDS